MQQADLDLVGKILDAVEESRENPNSPAFRTVNIKLTVPEVVQLRGLSRRFTDSMIAAENKNAVLSAKHSALL